VAREIHRPLLALQAVALVLLQGCLDWQALYEPACAGEGCTEARADSGLDTSEDPSTTGCDGGTCEPPETMCKTHCDAGSTAHAPDAASESTCGNGVREDREECDDGNDIDSDACLGDCTFARCGDGVVREHVEECDDGNTVDDATCSAQCLACVDEPEKRWLWSKLGHCYEYDGSKRTFADASATCASRGISYLVTLGGAGEDLPLQEALEGTAPSTLWLGLVRSGASFSWLGGGPATHTSWDDDQPAGSPADCVAETLLSDTDSEASDEATERGYLWRAEKCSSKFSFVCERAPAMVRKDDNHAYFAGFHPATWEEARSLCEASGAHLATIHDEAEHGFTSLASFVNMWVGANALDEPGNYRWITGEPWSYEAFAPWDEATDNDEQRCVLLSSDGYWYDKKCEDRYPYLCEVD
jgi:cysteine-rich repeat protein